MKRISIVITIITVMSLLVLITSCGQADNEQTQHTAESVKATQKTLPADDIGETAAKQIALNKVPGATEDDIYEFEKEYDDGLVQYEGKIIYKGCEYEFEINGETGDIFDWEIEKIN